MTAFLTAFLMVFLAELGDKTQLLVMAFAAKYRWQTVMLAVLIATVANHLVAIIIGIYVNTVINMDYIHLAAAATFFIFGIGTLISNEREEKLKDKRMLINPFWTVAVAFFLAETGDKTQLATIAMAARFGEWLPLLIGTTAGMIVADGLGVLAGTVINRYVSQKTNSDVLGHFLPYLRIHGTGCRFSYLRHFISSVFNGKFLKKSGCYLGNIK